MAWELEGKGRATTVATVGATPPCHVLCHDRLNPLKSRILKLSVPGMQGWSMVCLPIVTP